MNIVVVVQARVGSTRLPGKVLRPLCGKPLLLRMIERVMHARIPSTIVVATTTADGDDAIASLCEDNGIAVFRGDELDLLDRHYRAGRALDAEAVVKIPSDCPLIDPTVIDTVLGYFLDHTADFDFVSNLHPPSYPDGQDVEVMHMEVLETAWREARPGMEREHTTPFIWDHPDRFRIGNITFGDGVDYSMTHRWTIDYPEDYDFLCAVFDALHEEGAPPFGVRAILDLLRTRPDIHAINARYAGVNWYRNHLEELHTVDAQMTRQPDEAFAPHALHGINHSPGYDGS